MEKDEQIELFANIGKEDEGGQDGLDDDDKTVDKETDLQNTINEMQAKLDLKEEQYDQLNHQLSMAVSRPTEQKLEPSAIADEKLPELMEDPDGYAKALTKNIVNAIDGKNQVQRKQDANNARYDKLVNRFQFQEPELAKNHWDVVEFITTKKVNAATSQGVSVDTLIFANQDKFIADVAKDVRAMVGPKKEESDNNATQGLPSANGISQRAPSKKGEKAPKTFAESQKEIRRITPGFYNPASVKN